MAKKNILLSLLAGYMSISAAWADVSLSVTAFDDTYIDASNPDANYGRYGAMQVSGSDTSIRLAFIKFDASATVAAFDEEYGAGGWTLASASLSLATNYGTDGVQPGNRRFSPIADGDFDVSWFADDTWVDDNDETGLTYAMYESDYADTETSLLGRYYWAADGDGTTTYALSYLDGLLADLLNDPESLVSLLIGAADDEVSYLFNTTNNNPAKLVLVATAVPEPAHYAFALALPLALFVLARRRRTRGC